jgi:hypothetical protein
LYIYFETTLTAPKVKDLIHCPKQKYKSLFDTINKNLDNNASGSGGGGGPRTSAKLVSSSSLGIDDTESSAVYDESNCYATRKNNGGNDMKTDLKAFLRGIGLKSKTASEMSFRPSYEMS